MKPEFKEVVIFWVNVSFKKGGEIVVTLCEGNAYYYNGTYFRYPDTKKGMLYPAHESKAAAIECALERWKLTLDNSARLVKVHSKTVKESKQVLDKIQSIEV